MSNRLTKYRDDATGLFKQPFQLWVDRTLRINLEVDAVSFLPGEQDARGEELCQFSLEAGWRGPQVTREVVLVPPLSAVAQDCAKHRLPGLGKQSIQWLGDLTHNALVSTQFA